MGKGHPQVWAGASQTTTKQNQKPKPKPRSKSLCNNHIYDF